MCVVSLAIHGYAVVGSGQPPTQSEGFGAVHGAERELALVQEHPALLLLRSLINMLIISLKVDCNALGWFLKGPLCSFREEIHTLNFNIDNIDNKQIHIYLFHNWINKVPKGPLCLYVAEYATYKESKTVTQEISCPLRSVCLGVKKYIYIYLHFFPKTTQCTFKY